MNEYDTQAEKFLADCGLRFQARQYGVAGKCPSWCEDAKHQHGDQYRITLHRTGQLQPGRPRTLHFDFWNSVKDVQDGKTDVRPYDVLACISGDTNVADTFADFCGDMGLDDDSRKAEGVWKRCRTFSRRLQRFFAPDELTALSEIQ